MSRKYQYRNLPCTNKEWCVSGKDNRGGTGVLEWCYDEWDANNRMGMMQQDKGRFSNLKVGKWE